MKRNLFFLCILAVALAMTSCNDKNVLQVYETPFPLDELNAYFDVPNDSLRFASNNGDTILLIYSDPGDYLYIPYAYHGEWDDDDDEGDDENEDEESEGNEKYSESYGMETYQRDGWYKNPQNTKIRENTPDLQVSIYVSERVRASVSVTRYESQLEEGSKIQEYSKNLEFSKPSNDCLALFKDTLLLNNCIEASFGNGNYVETPDENDYVIIVRGKGLVEYTVYGTEVWHLVE